MARRIKRRPRVVWLPVSVFDRLGITPGTPAPTELSPMYLEVNRGTFGLPGAVGGSTTVLFPVVNDSPRDTTGAGVTTSLSDVENSAYRLRRIVGKLFVGVQQLDDEDVAIGGIITAGFIVLRVRNAGDNAVPLDAPFDYSVNAISNVADPWIWRRSWKLGNNAANLKHPQQGFPFYPENNAICGSVLDGPHVDAKTARVIGPEERLFLVLTATTTEVITQIPDTLCQVFCYGDFRVLASMRTSGGNRRNASR